MGTPLSARRKRGLSTKVDKILIKCRYMSIPIFLTKDTIHSKQRMKNGLSTLVDRVYI